MDRSFVSRQNLPEFSLWDKMKQKRQAISFDLEITARCNNNCRHCYINLPATDKNAQDSELTLSEIERIADEAVSLGAVWCLVTGGEPLVREDFFDAYLALKKKGLLVSVFTNATLLTKDHAAFFKKYPPRDIEISVYGVTKKTYEDVTRTSGSFDAFMKGFELLRAHDIKVRLKAMALRSNIHELIEIGTFCRKYTKDYFRFDPFLHLRFDRDKKRNEDIKAERLSPEGIVRIEKADVERFEALKKNCDKLINPEFSHRDCRHLFHCGAGVGSFVLGHDGIFRLCSSLLHKDCIYDLRKGTLREAWAHVVLQVRDIRSDKKEFIEKCHRCHLVNLCMWCPAHTYLETGEMDSWIEYFCEVAHARENMITSDAKT